MIMNGLAFIVRRKKKRISDLRNGNIGFPHYPRGRV